MSTLRDSRSTVHAPTVNGLSACQTGWPTAQHAQSGWSHLQLAPNLHVPVLM